MKAAIATVAAILIAGTPALAKSHRHNSYKMGSQGSAGLGGNGTTTSSSSGSIMKAGAKRSPTGGAPVR